MLLGQLEMEFVERAKSDERVNLKATPMVCLVGCAEPLEQPSLVWAQTRIRTRQWPGTAHAAQAFVEAMLHLADLGVFDVTLELVSRRCCGRC